MENTDIDSTVTKFTKVKNTLRAYRTPLIVVAVVGAVAVFVARTNFDVDETETPKS